MIGPLPPPIGGVAVYVDRLMRKLQREGHTVIDMDYGIMNRFQRFLALASIVMSRYDRYHIHCTSIGLALVFTLSGMTVRARYTVHSEAVRGWGKVKKFIMRAFMSRCLEIIWVGPHLAELYQLQLGNEFPNGIVESEFIPPPEEDEEKILRTYGEATHRFIDSADPLIVANAYRIELVDGVDLYGIDICIELIETLRKEYPKIGLLFALAEIGLGEERMNHDRSERTLADIQDGGPDGSADIPGRLRNQRR